MADSRYLTMADKLFNLNSNAWARCYLSVSYRLTAETAAFVNKCMNGRLFINTIKSNKSPPQYKILNTHIVNDIIMMIMKFLHLGYKPDDIFILAPSIKIKNNLTVMEHSTDKKGPPVKLLENKLKELYPQIPIYVPCTDSERLDGDVLAGKILFSTYHQSKGMERPVVFVYGFDDSYFKYYKRNVVDKSQMVNELYVATTRASQHLILIHHFTNSNFEFITEAILKSTCDIAPDAFSQIKKKKDNDKKPSAPMRTRTTVMDILSHLNFSIILKALEFIEWTAIRHIEIGRAHV